jgi:hypothetical protein
MPVSFKTDILPLFRQIDIDHMRPSGVLLDDVAYMTDPSQDYDHTHQVQDYLTGAKIPRMPPGGPFWSDDQLQLYSRWIADGFQP